MEPENAVVAFFVLVVLVLCGMLGAFIMRDNIKKECDRFGKTSINDKQYACTGLGKQ
jgi:hypothetical protein